MSYTHRNQNNITLVVIFASCVLFLITASLVIKFIGVLNKSTYSSGQRYTVLLLDSTQEAMYLSVDESEKTSSKLVIEEAESAYDLPVGVDGIVHVSSDIDSNKSIGSLVSEMLIRRNEKRIGVTFFDLIRMNIALRGVPPDNVSVVQASKVDDVSVAKLRSLFVDERVLDEDKTVAIENGTSKSGVATKLENIISVMGGNVISVETSVSQQPNSKIMYDGDMSHTVRKLHRFLGYPLEQTLEKQVAEISIIIGEDGFGNSIFPEGEL